MILRKPGPRRWLLRLAKRRMRWGERRLAAAPALQRPLLAWFAKKIKGLLPTPEAGKDLLPKPFEPWFGANDAASADQQPISARVWLNRAGCEFVSRITGGAGDLAVIWAANGHRQMRRQGRNPLVMQSGRPDLNRGPLVPQTSALTRLRYAPSTGDGIATRV